MWGCHQYGDALIMYRRVLELAEKAYYTEGIELARIGGGLVLWSIGRYEAAASSLESGLKLARELNSGWDIGYGLVYLSNVQASLGDTVLALRTNHEAVTEATAAGAGYPQPPGPLLPPLEAGGVRSHGRHLSGPRSRRRSERLGRSVSDGLATCLAWLRLMHRIPDQTISDEILDRELNRRTRLLAVGLPVKGPWEALGTHVVRRARECRPGRRHTALGRCGGQGGQGQDGLARRSRSESLPGRS